MKTSKKARAQFQSSSDDSSAILDPLGEVSAALFGGGNGCESSVPLFASKTDYNQHDPSSSGDMGSTSEPLPPVQPLNVGTYDPTPATLTVRKGLEVEKKEADRRRKSTSRVSSYYSVDSMDLSLMTDLERGRCKSVDNPGAENGEEQNLQEELLKENCPPRTKNSMSVISLANTADQSASNTKAKTALVSLLSGLYALLLIILAFAFKMSIVNVSKVVKEPNHYETYYIYLYTVSIGFLVFCCVLLCDLNPILEIILRIFPCLSHFITSKWLDGRTSNSTGQNNNGGHLSDQNQTLLGANTANRANGQCRSPPLQIVGASHAASATGSLYLRLGAIVFGTVGVVQNCLQFFSFFETRCFSTSTVITLVLFTVFLYGQVFFVFLNSKIVIHRCQIIGRFGLMHLVATNLCVWIRSLVEEEHHLSEEISESQHTLLTHGRHGSNRSSKTSEEKSIEELSVILKSNVAFMIKCSQKTENVMTKILQDVKPFMTTCVIEYSLICAAVMLIIWMNVGNAQIGVGNRHRNHNIRVDCSSTNKGLFAGLICLVFTVVSMVIFFVEVHRDTESGGSKALLVFYCSDITLYAVTIIACLAAFYRFRKLQCIDMKGRSSKFIRRSTLLDDILLMVALVGQVMFCILSIVAIVNMNMHAILHISVTLMRLIQVLLQTVVILIGQRMTAASSRSQVRKPGRELITFLLLVNIALFLINSFEVQKASANPLLVELYGNASHTWTNIVHSTIPLTIFYRFHSTVCLVEIWKNAYKSK